MSCQKNCSLRTLYPKNYCCKMLNLNLPSSYIYIFVVFSFSESFLFCKYFMCILTKDFNLHSLANLSNLSKLTLLKHAYKTSHRNFYYIHNNFHNLTSCLSTYFTKDVTLCLCWSYYFCGGYFSYCV